MSLCKDFIFSELGTTIAHDASDYESEGPMGSNPAGRTREDPLISITYSVFRLSILVP
jgi:hypothetical protein